MAKTPERINAMSDGKEQRNHKRFQAPKGVLVGIGREFNRVGPLIELSIIGLAFKYVGTKKPPKGSYVAIFMSDGDFYLGNLPIKPTIDCQVVETDPSASSTLRRCGVKFGKLTDQQKAELERFIKEYTVAEA
ncbi:MAG: PilZ domain-containing protein [Desulfobacterales bacterium]|nr:MAG: PilZ domain-containing protein [Desulfobacterales bacterium]